MQLIRVSLIDVLINVKYTFYWPLERMKGEQAELPSPEWITGSCRWERETEREMYKAVGKMERMRQTSVLKPLRPLRRNSTSSPTEHQEMEKNFFFFLLFISKQLKI